jgi:c-di-GMP-binding flagellar brake protein YcgR
MRQDEYESVATPNKQSELSDLLAMKPSIGDVLQLQDYSAEKTRHYVKLMGFLNKKSVLVSHPMNEDKLLFVKKGESFLVRGFSGTKTYDFSSDVINVCLAPYPYLHLSFPTQINAVSMRSAMRIKIRLVCSIKHKAAERPVTATIDDMSISGARIQSKLPIGKLGDEIEVSFRIPLDGADQLLMVPAIIRNQSKDTEAVGETNQVTGLEFVQSDGNERNVLQYFIYKNLAES